MSRRKNSAYQSPFEIVKDTLTSDRAKLIWFLLFVLLAVVELIGFLSYLGTWKEDQSKFEIGWIQFLFDSEIEVANWSHKLGALIAHIFIHNLFGLPSFVFVPLTLLVGCKIVDIEPVPLRTTAKWSLLVMFWLSITLGFFFGDFSFYYGGLVGYESAYWLESVFGKVGTILLLIITALILVVFAKDSVMEWIKIFFDDFSKHRNFKHAAQTARQYTSTSQQDIIDQVRAKNAGQYISQQRDNDDFDYVDEDEEENQLNAPVNRPSSQPQSVSPFSFIKEKLFKNKDYKGQDQKIEFEEKPKETTANEHFILDDNGQKLQTSDVGFEVDDTTKHQEETDMGMEIERTDSPEGETEAAAPAASSDGTMLEVETNHDITVDSVNQLPPYDPTLELQNYKLPSIDLLEDYKSEGNAVDNNELLENKIKIVEALKNFKIKIDKIKATIGPTVTLYEIVPAAGVRISKIQNLEADIMLSLKALGIRIIAPMPGRGTVGIEVPNKNPEIVSMRSLVASTKFQESKYELPIALGKDISNQSYVMDLTKCPHLLVAGATGQGKSVGLNTIVASILYRKHPAQVKFVLVDPKKVELTLYNNIEKHYLAKLPDSEEAIITDVDKVKETLNSLTVEMTNRYDLLKEAGVRNIKEYNQKFIARHLNPEKGHKFLPYIVLIIDEFADLIMTAGKEIEKPIARIAQLARAIGIHMIVATQRPTTNIITGLIKANFPTRIAFKVSSMMDSRTILDCSGAQHLIGRGDMLISNGSDLTRLQCAFIDTPELERITKFIGEQQGYPHTFELPEPDIEPSEGGEAVDLTKRDPLFEEAARLIVISQQGSTSLLQRKMEIGYNRAGRIMDQLEAAGIVGPNEGSKARSVNYTSEYDLMQFLNRLYEENQ
ncbi:MAG: DNA translocase FtsK 4TM domain-containing protein [Bacteroidales bacterium]|nr:DNA translocase FtsK 4TM domain-containing protein [Bacteroidales bacterium]